MLMPPKPASANKAGAALARIEPKTLKGLRAWLAKNHAQTDSVWVVYVKKAAGGVFAASDITDEALCFGWIDSLPRSLDDTHAMLMISPRKARSGWSAVNKAKVEKLIADGRMAPPGLAAIEAAKASGAWDKLASVDALEEPADLIAALKAAPPARDHWRAFPPSTRRGILEWILNAKRPDTRAKRIAETARLAAQNKRANQWRP
jgi:uncharacterized protein YdeI (YjbR/CyaY-like superfamily)